MAVGLAENRNDPVANSPYLAFPHATVGDLCAHAGPRQGARCRTDGAHDSPLDVVLAEGIDSDIDLRIADERAEGVHISRILFAIAVGGMIGAACRYLLSDAWPTANGGFPWATFTINTSGCFALGLLMGAIAGRERPHPLIRPLIGVGVIGGYTTFSTYVVETNTLLEHHHPILGLTYLWGSVVAGLASALCGHTLADHLRSRSEIGA